MYSLAQDSIKIISKNLYIGDFLASINYNILVQYNITHILVCGSELSCRYPDRFEYKHLKINDCPTQSLKEFFDETHEFIRKGTQKGRVLVHCGQAKSRSVSFILSYIMRSQNLRFKKALEMLKKLHPQADPNQGFKNQLIQYEKEILPESSCFIF